MFQSPRSKNKSPPMPHLTRHPSTVSGPKLFEAVPMSCVSSMGTQQQSCLFNPRYVSDFFCRLESCSRAHAIPGCPPCSAPSCGDVVNSTNMKRCYADAVLVSFPQPPPTRSPPSIHDGPMLGAIKSVVCLFSTIRRWDIRPHGIFS